MMNRKADSAKLVGLLCAPFLPLVALLAVQHYRAEANTQQLLGGLEESHNPSVNRVAELIRQGADVNARREGGVTHLHLAFSLSTAEMQTLLDHGADVNARDRYGATCLIHAASPGDLKSVRFLLEHGARVNDQYVDEGHKVTALSTARERIRLTYAYSTPTAQAKMIPTALTKRFLEIIQMLKAAGARE